MSDQLTEPPSPDQGLVAEGIARFVPPGFPAEALRPSFATVGQVRASEALPDGWHVHPSWSRSSDAFEAYISIESDTSLYGTGEVAGRLLRNGTVTEVWAKQPFRIEADGTVVPNYDDRSPSLYQAHPWVLVVRADGTAFGVIGDTTHRLTIDLRQGITLRSSVPFAVLIIEGDSPQHVLSRLGDLTGTMELPPVWSLGYQQSRFSYYPDERVRELARELRSRRIPCDVIWIDIHYMDAYKVFTFDSERFPDPKATNRFLHDHGFRSVWILDPAVKAEPGYSVYDDGVQGGHFVRDHEGQEYRAATWPGDAAFPDYTRPATRTWWKDRSVEFLDNEMDGLWIDLNEPSPILPPGSEVPETVQHEGGGGIPAGSHARYHNVYGMLMAQATHEAMKEARPDRRPFVLTRSNYLGGQRFAATWTGDNVASWDHLKWSVPMVLNLGLSGQPFSGPDIGGFAGLPSPELFAHWIGVGAFFPFSRTHTSLKESQEPWSFGPQVEAIARASLGRRYKLLPYLYTVFREAASSGLPVMRPVFFADPTDLRLRSEDRAFLLGDDLLVLPQLSKEEAHDFCLPKGRWRPVTLPGEDLDASPAHPALRIREGSIIPVGPGGQTADEAMTGPLTLLVSLDREGHAGGTVYEDGGDGYGYQGGDYLLTRYSAEVTEGRLVISIEAEEGARSRPEREVRVEWITDPE
ncbi:MAG: TIM-barrel domain-containing protein [Myxococcota bacterium]